MKENEEELEVRLESDKQEEADEMQVENCMQVDGCMQVENDCMQFEKDQNEVEN